MIGLLGGSFDPIHHGHLIAAQLLRDALELSEIRFVPARLQPFKAGRHAATAEQRAAMVALAIGSEPGFVLERSELDRPGPSYTVDTLRGLRASQPGADLVLLIGADAAAEFPAWREAPQIPQLARVVVFGRGGMEPPSVPGLWRTVELPPIDISGSEIRRRVASGRSIRYWVPDAVAGYITDHGLYRDGNG